MNVRRFLCKRDTAFVPSDAIFMVITTVIIMFSFMTFATQQTESLQQEFIMVGFHNPKFHEQVRGVAGIHEGMDYGIEHPTNNYLAFEYFRTSIFPYGALLLLGYVMVMAWGQATGMFGKNAKKTFIMFIVTVGLTFVFVPLWDNAAVGAEKLSVTMLNPVYEHESNPPRCVPTPEGSLLYDVKQSNTAISIKLQALHFTHVPDLNKKGPCDPNLHLAYIYDKVRRGAIDVETEQIDGVLQSKNDIISNVLNLGQALGPSVFLGMTKVMILFMTTLSGTIFMVVRELLAAMIISLFPLLVILAFLPTIGSKFKELLVSLPAILLVPTIMAAVMFTGSAFLFDAEKTLFADHIQCNGAGDPVEECRGPSDTFSADGRGAGDQLLFWVTSLAVLAFLMHIPILMVPMLGNLGGQITSMVGHAVQAGAASASQIGTQAAGGAMAGGKKGWKSAAAGGGGLGAKIKGAVAGGAKGTAYEGSIKGMHGAAHAEGQQGLDMGGMNMPGAGLGQYLPDPRMNFGGAHPSYQMGRWSAKGQGVNMQPKGGGGGSAGGSGGDGGDAAEGGKGGQGGLGGTADPGTNTTTSKSETSKESTSSSKQTSGPRDQSGRDATKGAEKEPKRAKAKGGDATATARATNDAGSARQGAGGGGAPGGGQGGDTATREATSNGDNDPNHGTPTNNSGDESSGSTGNKSNSGKKHNKPKNK